MNWLAALALGYLALALQVTLVQHIGIAGARPDLALVATVMVASSRGAASGVLVGFLVGLGQDLTNPTFLGVNALAKTILGWGIGRMQERAEAGSVLLHAGILLGATLVHDIVYLTVYTRLALSEMLRDLFLRSLPSAFYTAAVGMWFLALAASWSGRKGQRLGRSSFASR